MPVIHNILDDLQTVIYHCGTCNLTWRRRWPANDLHSNAFYATNHCPACGEPGRRPKLVKGIHTSGHCTATCHNAKTTTCRCSCAGANHAAALDSSQLKLAS